MNRSIFVGLLFVAAVLVALVINNMLARSVPVQTEEKETFAQREVGMPLDMQAVEGATGVAGYSGTPPLLGSEPKPISDKPYDMANDNELFLFEGNRMSADCCPSPFSGDRGCICLTDKQIKEFETRGGNHGA
jgi:hypothetical protein